MFTEPLSHQRTSQTSKLCVSFGRDQRTFSHTMPYVQYCTCRGLHDAAVIPSMAKYHVCTPRRLWSDAQLVSTRCQLGKRLYTSVNLTYNCIASLAIQLSHIFLVLLPFPHTGWGFQVGFICASCRLRSQASTNAAAKRWFSKKDGATHENQV